MDGDLETLVRSCTNCQSCQSMRAMAPLHHWFWPSQSWQCIHIDYAGPVSGRMLLIIVDARHKWPEVAPMSSTTSQATIRALMHLFVAHGLPQQLVSNNSLLRRSTFLLFLTFATFLLFPTAPHPTPQPTQCKVSCSFIGKRILVHVKTCEMVLIGR